MRLHSSVTASSRANRAANEDAQKFVQTAHLQAEKAAGQSPPSASLSPSPRYPVADISPRVAVVSFILANTEQLHEKIKVMSDRIRQLEDALQHDHAQLPSQTPHPLLSEDLLQIKTSSELFGLGRDNAGHAGLNGDNARRPNNYTNHNNDDDDGPSGSSVPPGELEDPNVRVIIAQTSVSTRV